MSVTAAVSSSRTAKFEPSQNVLALRHHIRIFVLAPTLARARLHGAARTHPKRRDSDRALRAFAVAIARELGPRKTVMRSKLASECARRHLQQLLVRAVIFTLLNDRPDARSTFSDPSDVFSSCRPRQLGLIDERESWCSLMRYMLPEFAEGSTLSVTSHPRLLVATRRTVLRPTCIQLARPSTCLVLSYLLDI